MTNLEYCDLRHKIISKNINSKLSSLLIGFCVSAAIAFLNDVVNKSDAAFENFTIFFSIFSIAIIMLFDRYDKRETNLKKLYKKGSSYEDALKELGLYYEPPKN